MAPRYLLDTSALARGDRAPVKERLTPLMHAGHTAICGVVALELLYSARSEADMVARRSDLARTFVMIETGEADFLRAQDLMQELAANGMHRSAGIADVLVAACAQRAGLTLLHYDADFDLIAQVTGQPAEWVVPRGSIP